MNIFKLAFKELKREGLIDRPNSFELAINRAIKIRNWLDKQERNKKVAKNRGV